MKLSILALVALMTMLGRAEAAPVAYRCELILTAEGVPPGNSFWRFEVADDTGSHGGPERVFRLAGHELVVVVNGRWLGLQWNKDEKKVAEALFVLGSGDEAQERAGIIYDPSNSDNQVGISCSGI